MQAFLTKKIESINCALSLSRKIVGMKFLFSQQGYDSFDIPELKGSMSYCAMVKAASCGRAFKASDINFKCKGATKALGLEPMADAEISGEFYYSLGLYQDIATARKFQEDITFCKHHATGVVLQPLEKFEELPDVVIFITDAYNAMRIIQGYSYKYGLYQNYKLGGSQGICAEVTACAYEKNNINISTLCSGTRFYCNWGKDELAIGVPGNMFDDIVNGVIQTLNSTEPLKEKLKIDQKFKEKEISFNVDIKNSYYYSYSDKQVELAQKKMQK